MGFYFAISYNHTGFNGYMYKNRYTGAFQMKKTHLFFHNLLQFRYFVTKEDQS